MLRLDFLQAGATAFRFRLDDSGVRATAGLPVGGPTEAALILAPAEPLGRAYRGMQETHRWTATASVGGGAEEAIGEVWRADDGRVCWMFRPEWLDESLPDPRVASGYSATSKKWTARELMSWSLLRPLGFGLGDLRLHCASAHDRGSQAQFGFLAVGAGALRWVHLTHTREPLRGPSYGLNGVPGWHSSSYRGERMISVHGCASMTEAAAFALVHAGRELSDEERRQDRLRRHSAEHHFGSAWPDQALREDADAVLAAVRPGAALGPRR